MREKDVAFMNVTSFFIVKETLFLYDKKHCKDACSREMKLSRLRACPAPELRKQKSLVWIGRLL